MNNAVLTSTEERILKLLGDGLRQDIVASAVGVSESRISQLLSDDQFREQLAELRYRNLSKHNERDNKYDQLEDTLLAKLEDQVPMMFSAPILLKAIATINSAKRRGSSAPESVVQKQTVIPLVLPIQIIQQFSVNAANQVVQAGQQELVTVQSGNMKHLLEQHKTSPRTQDVELLNSPEQRIGTSG